ncbi:unnamed protein product [Didymodactylos carnosus]|uniref:Uncharacterized protein n=1 Tax=Didymodactylos carnosus TaxID=1234261 RepID=A0A815VWV1_9BILA|nr:unnamed protein product [Didymodactylos carnosus]CAF1682027.1 unnamed protein product [Didymodactylos carnosus]CAF4400813.1 unnamed protein product [Didymodactylos carnosus]CAF4577609.1 unnamed protein product [Didymodactylos carnosus]
MSKLSLLIALSLLVCVAYSNADEYSGAIKALQYINAHTPIRIRVIAGSYTGQLGIWLNIDSGAYMDALTTHQEVVRCGTAANSYLCIFKG